ncbi:Hypothetical predicted protein [Mytilus galloprovincialis]|uniref:N-acetyltransferase domain-containing protein n=1 Tax=Mytilus galloprovincialis TaxID=29158 RepID=A0A8B6E9N4_MYTGA|nr:Hypothetical predicted protein [Mytilus galloprovincialis]
MAIVTQQPFYTAAAVEEVLYNHGPIKIRKMMDTHEDCSFYAHLSTEAFTDKVVHATKESSIPKVIEFTRVTSKGRPQEVYNRIFVAEYDGVRAGLCSIGYHGDTEKFPERSSDLVPDFDCCDLCGLFCLDFATTENVPVGHCYIECICVDDKFRGKGIGKVLLNVVETDAKHHNCRTMYLWVVSSNRAKNLYSRQGYVVTENTTCCLRCILGVKKAYRMDKPV